MFISFGKLIWFIGTKISELVKNLPSNPQVNLAYDLSGNNYVSIHGVATLVDDPEKLDELWSSAYEAFFEQGKNDPNVQLIHITAKGAQYWEGAGTIATIFKLGKAAITGQSEQLGTTKNVDL